MSTFTQSFGSCRVPVNPPPLPFRIGVKPPVLFPVCLPATKQVREKSESESRGVQG